MINRTIPTIVFGTIAVLALLMVEFSGDISLAMRWAIRSWAVCLFATSWFTFYSRRRLGYAFLLIQFAVAVLVCLARAQTPVINSVAPADGSIPVSQAISTIVAVFGFIVFVGIPPFTAMLAAVLWDAQRKATQDGQDAQLDHTP
ncbi:hypothetical protein [Variovorax gossypii]